MQNNPQKLLAEYNKKYSAAWKLADEFRADSGKDLPDWPAWCFLPLAGWYAITCELLNKKLLTINDMPLMQTLAALGAWRPSQDVFTFDQTIYEAIADTELSGAIPCDVALRLPVWCAYVELQGDNAPGVFVHLEEDADDGRKEMRFLFYWASGETRAVPLHLGDFSLEESIARMMAEAKRNVPEIQPLPFDAEMQKWITHALNLTLYLCSDGIEWPASGNGGQAPASPHPKKTKKGIRLFPPNQMRIWHIGGETGRIMRESRGTSKDNPHGSPSPHIRRAHWHGFWSGTIKPKPGIEPKPRRFELRWMPPIPVGLKEDERELDRTSSAQD